MQQAYIILGLVDIAGTNVVQRWRFVGVRLREAGDLGEPSSPLASHWSPHSAPRHFVTQDAHRVGRLPPRLHCSCSAVQSVAAQSSISPLPNSPPPTLLLHYSSLPALQSRPVQSTICRIKPGSQGPKVPVQILLEGNAKYVTPIVKKCGFR